MHRRILAVLSFGHLATDLAQGAVPALLPGFKALFHLSYAGVGFIVLMASVSSSVIQPIFGFLSDRLRLRWLMPLGALLSGVGIVFAVRAPQYPLMLTALLCSGIGVAAFHPEGYRFAGLAAGDRRATGMSYFSVGGNIGYGFGPAVATIALTVGGTFGMSYLLVFSFIGAVLLWRFLSPSQMAQLEAGWAVSPYATVGAVRAAEARTTPLVVLVLLVLFVIMRSWVQVGLASFIPLFFTEVRHFDPRYGGTLASVFLGSGAIGTLLGGPLADRWGRRPQIIVSMGILPPLLWALARLSGIWAFVVAAFAGMALVSTFAVVMVIAQDLMPARIGMISGLLIGFGVGMGGVGVTALGVLADRWGLLAAMDVIALLPVVGLAIAVMLPSERVPASARPVVP